MKSPEFQCLVYNCLLGLVGLPVLMLYHIIYLLSVNSSIITSVIITKCTSLFLLTHIMYYYDLFFQDLSYLILLWCQIRILNYTRYKMLNKALEAFGDLGDDEELGPADWSTVQRYITCLNNLDEEQVHPHIVSESEHHLQATNLRDIRIRLLNGKLSQ